MQYTLVHLDEPKAAIGARLRYEATRAFALIPMELEEREIGEEVRTRETGIRMRTLLLDRTTAVAVRERLLGTSEPLLRPLRGGVFLVVR